MDAGYDGIRRGIRARYPGGMIARAGVGIFLARCWQLPTWTYNTTADSLAINLFVGSTFTIKGVAGTDLQIVQKTDYPWNGNVAITLNPTTPKTFAVKVRIPHRSVSTLYSSTPDADGITSIALNGQAITPAEENGYAVITREWHAGDRIDLVLPMAVQRVKAIDKVAADRGRVADSMGRWFTTLRAWTRMLTRCWRMMRRCGRSGSRICWAG